MRTGQITLRQRSVDIHFPTFFMKGILVALCMLACASTVSAQQKVGIVDEAFVLNDLPETKKVEAEIKALIGRWADTAKQYSKLIDDRRNALVQKTAKMSSAERRAAIDTIGKMQQMLSQYTTSKQQNGGELTKERANRYAPILSKYKEALTTIAKREKIDIIINKTGLIYQSPAVVDISPLVKKEMK